MSETREEMRARMSRMGKRRLVTMTQAKRTALSYAAGVKGGRPRLIDRERMLELRAAGKLHRGVLEELNVSMASVTHRTPNRSRISSARPRWVTIPIRAHASWTTIRLTVMTGNNQSSSKP